MAKFMDSVIGSQCRLPALFAKNTHAHCKAKWEKGKVISNLRPDFCAKVCAKLWVRAWICAWVRMYMRACTRAWVSACVNIMNICESVCVCEWICAQVCADVNEYVRECVGACMNEHMRSMYHVLPESWRHRLRRHQWPSWFCCLSSSLHAPHPPVQIWIETKKSKK